MQEQISNIILGLDGPSDRFTLRYGWFTFHMKIKPLSARQVIEASGQLSRISDVDVNNDMFPEMIKNSGDLRHIAKAITIATGSRYRKIVTRAILGLTPADIFTLLKVVKKQMNCDVFFYTITLAGGLNKLKPKEQ